MLFLSGVDDKRRRWHPSRGCCPRPKRPALSVPTCAYPVAYPSERFSIAARIKPVSAAWAKRCACNLSDALSDKLDKEILSGGSGLLHGTILANHNASAVTSYANYRSAVGLWPG